VYSLVRGPWELRLARVDDLSDGVDVAALRLRVGGWAVPGAGPAAVAAGAVSVTGSGPTSRLDAVLGGTATTGATTFPDGGPLAGPLVVPWLEYPARVGAWVGALIELSGGPTPPDRRTCRTALAGDSAGARVTVEWPDGVSTTAHLGSTR
jgi:hypothetical protein